MMTTKTLTNLALDLWELADDYGTAPVSATQWCQRHQRKGASMASTMRRWERFKAAIRTSPFPADFVPVICVAKKPEGMDDAHRMISDTYEHLSGIGIQLPAGAKAELTRILDAHAGVEA